MYFQRFYDTRLAQASYQIGCQLTGDAVVVDPNRDVQQYIDAAAQNGLRVTVLQARGIRKMVNLVGGYAAWERAGLPTTRDAGESVS